MHLGMGKSGLKTLLLSWLGLNEPGVPLSGNPEIACPSNVGWDIATFMRVCQATRADDGPKATPGDTDGVLEVLCCHPKGLASSVQPEAWKYLMGHFPR